MENNNNPNTIISFALSIISIISYIPVFLCSCFVIVPILCTIGSITTGFVGLSQIRKTNERGAEYAYAGIGISFAQILVILFSIGVLFLGLFLYIIISSAA